MSRIRLPRTAGSGEPVHVWLRASGGIPDEFIWRGRRHRVRTVEAIPAGGPREPGRGLRMKVVTSTGLHCILRQDPAIGSWSIDRLVGLGGAR